MIKLASNKYDEKRKIVELKLDLFCNGIRVDNSCNLKKDSRGILRTRGGLGSGLEAVLPGGFYINIPIEEPFVKKSPYVLKKKKASYYIHEGETQICKLKIFKKPAFYDKKTSNGKKMSKIGVMQGTYLAIYPTKLCSFWEMKPKMNCRFCSVGLNLGENEEREKTVSDVIETVKAARKEENITFVHFNTGFDFGKEVENLLPYIKAVKKETGLLVGVQCPPASDFSIYDKLKRIGVDHVSFCMELYGKDSFSKICPGKNKYLGQKKFLDTISYCVKLFGKGRIAGEIIVGLEDKKESIKAIKRFARMGAVSTVCVFRSCVGTDLEKLNPPKKNDIINIFKKMYEVCVENNIPVDIAPNIKVSLVVLPYEGRYLVDNTITQYLYDMRMAILKTLYYLYFNIKITTKR